jgi:hypothetical protein
MKTNFFPGIKNLLLFFILFVRATTMTAEATLSNLSEQWKEIRSIKGHWQDGEYTKEVDGFNGKKHLLMKEMHELLKDSPTAIM